MSREQETQTLSASEVRQEWSQVLNKVYRDKSRIIVERSGIPVAAIISVQDLERLKRYDEEWEKDFAVLDEFADAFRDIPEEELEREVRKAVVEARQELRRERELQVTDDVKLQRIGVYESVRIVSPREFLEVLERGSV